MEVSMIAERKIIGNVKSCIWSRLFPILKILYSFQNFLFEPFHIILKMVFIYVCHGIQFSFFFLSSSLPAVCGESGEYMLLSGWSGQEQKNGSSEEGTLKLGFTKSRIPGTVFGSLKFQLHIIPLVQKVSAYFPQIISSSQAPSGVNHTFSASHIIFSLETLDGKVMMRGLMGKKKKPANAKL